MISRNLSELWQFNQEVKFAKVCSGKSFLSEAHIARIKTDMLRLADGHFLDTMNDYMVDT